ncbi:VanZ like family protein [Nocardioides dokdonensis FR1436]|uniref:VanZ like family protein n=1 Tax=Nocardioides dokdonensis FR1436 TaxID=1300347 RepID=A0A1A9GJ73_9ACTN|nr:VanZ family protein [Nocardioides dokdonensis]ANH37551.1 VanZ like family protein [Nocardioides dokdonensis FR1436]
MSDQALNALVAIGLGSVVAVLLLVPTAAVRYRRHGRLPPAELLVLLAAAVYGLALWTYTLLPLPDPGSFVCRPTQLDPFTSVGRVSLPESGGVRALLRQPAFLQVALNVLLFVPFGFFVRRVLRRGVLVAGLLGLLASALIETTQGTGLWGFYDCAYRLLDVDDLLLNTLGAVLGSLASWALVRRSGPEARPLPSRVTWGRRLVGMACDAVFVVAVGAAVALGLRVVHVYVLDLPTWRDLQVLLQWSVPFALEAVLVLGSGRTVGEWVVSLHTRSRRRWLLVPQRVVKLAAGLGPVFALGLADLPWGGAALAAYLALTLLATGPTREHRGLSHVLAGLDLRAGASARPAERAS